MVELRERLRLVADVAGDLQRHQPLHRTLPGEEHPRERAVTQLHHQVEIVEAFTDVEVVARAEFRSDGPPVHAAVVFEEGLEPGRLLRVFGDVLGGIDVGATLTADPVLQVDEFRWQRFGEQFREFEAIVGDTLRVARPQPPVLEVHLDQLDQRGPPDRGRVGEILGELGRRTGRLPIRDQALDTAFHHEHRFGARRCRRRKLGVLTQFGGRPRRDRRITRRAIVHGGPIPGVADSGRCMGVLARVFLTVREGYGTAGRHALPAGPEPVRGVFTYGGQ